MPYALPKWEFARTLGKKFISSQRDTSGYRMTALLQQQQDLQCEFCCAGYGDKSFLSHPCSILWSSCKQNLKKNPIVSSLVIVEICLITNNDYIPCVSKSCIRLTPQPFFDRDVQFVILKAYDFIMSLKYLINSTVFEVHICLVCSAG